MFAPPCGTSSNALFLTGRLRSTTEPWGKTPDLIEAQRAKVKAASKIVRAVLKTVKLFHEHGVPWIVENPDTSLMWHFPFFRDIVKDPAVTVGTVGSVQIPTRVAEENSFICGNIAADDLGRPHNGGAKHFQLQGQSPSGVLWTTIAAAYPAGMASALAHALTAADVGCRSNLVKS